MSDTRTNAYLRGNLHYWISIYPNEYDEGSIEYADWQQGHEDAIEQDKHNCQGRDLEYAYTQE